MRRRVAGGQHTQSSRGTTESTTTCVANTTPLRIEFRAAVSLGGAETASLALCCLAYILTLPDRTIEAKITVDSETTRLG